MNVDPLANYLKMFRRRSGLNQGELARLLGARSGSKVGRYERGSRHPSFESLLAYEVIFQVSLDALFLGEAQPLGRAVSRRARALLRDLQRAATLTPATKRKVDFLSGLLSNHKLSRA